MSLLVLQYSEGKIQTSPCARQIKTRYSIKNYILHITRINKCVAMKEKSNIFTSVHVIIYAA